MLHLTDSSWNASSNHIPKTFTINTMVVLWSIRSRSAIRNGLSNEAQMFLLTIRLRNNFKVYTLLVPERLLLIKSRLYSFSSRCWRNGMLFYFSLISLYCIFRWRFLKYFFTLYLKLFNEYALLSLYSSFLL